MSENLSQMIENTPVVDKATASRIATQAAIVREIEKNPDYSKARRMIRSIGWTCLAVAIVFQIILLIVISATTIENDVVHVDYASAAFFVIFAYLRIFLKLFRIKEFARMQSYSLIIITFVMSALAVFISYTAGLAIGIITSLVCFTVLIVVGVLVYKHPLFILYRRRTHEIIEENKPHYERRKVAEYTRM